jgi:hypothetical protein
MDVLIALDRDVQRHIATLSRKDRQRSFSKRGKPSHTSPEWTGLLEPGVAEEARLLT